MVAGHRDYCDVIEIFSRIARYATSRVVNGSKD